MPTLYYIFTLDGGTSGLSDEDYDASVATLKSLTATLNADCMLLRQRNYECGVTGQFLVRQRADDTDFMEIRYILKFQILTTSQMIFV